jgi:hypothetical protein
LHDAGATSGRTKSASRAASFNGGSGGRITEAERPALVREIDADLDQREERKGQRGAWCAGP